MKRRGSILSSWKFHRVTNSANRTPRCSCVNIRKTRRKFGSTAPLLMLRLARAVEPGEAGSHEAVVATVVLVLLVVAVVVVVSGAAGIVAVDEDGEGVRTGETMPGHDPDDDNGGDDGDHSNDDGAAVVLAEAG